MNGNSNLKLGIALVCTVAVGLMGWLFITVQALQIEAAQLQSTVAAWERAVSALNDTQVQQKAALEKANDLLYQIRVCLASGSKGCK